MLTHSDFCTFILSHGRPNNIKTLHPLLNTGNYSGPWYIIIDNEDSQRKPTISFTAPTG